MPITLDDITLKEIDQLKGRRQQLIEKNRRVQLQLRKVNKLIYRLEHGRPDIEVSVHAMKRYQERIECISHYAIKKKFYDNTVLIERIEAFGTGRYHAGNCIVVVEDDTIVTVLTFEMQ